MYWVWMLAMYLITISIETPILLVGLSPRHSVGRRLFCGVWLTACTYPVLWLVLPALIDVDNHYVLYLTVGETFVAIAECAIFWAAFGTQDEWARARCGAISRRSRWPTWPHSGSAR